MLKTITGGMGLAGKLMGRGVDEAVKAIRRDEPEQHNDTGLYFAGWEASDWQPRLRFFESQEKGKLNVNLLKNLTMSGGEKDFLAGLSALISGQRKEAVVRLREATKKGDAKSQLTDAYFLLGAILICQGETEEAERLLKTALLAQQALGKHLHKYSPSLHVAIALTRHSCFCVYPDFLGLNLLLAMAQHARDPEGAVATLEQFLEILPGEQVALFFLNLLRLRTGAYRDIFSSLARSLPDSNLMVACMLLLGRACEHLGDPTTAREIYRKALQRQDLDHTLRLDLRTALAGALEAEGYSRDSEHELRTVAQEDPHHKQLEERFGVRGPKAALREPEPQPAVEEVPAAAPVVKPPAHEGPIIDPQGSISRLNTADGSIDVPLAKGTLVIGRDEGDIQLDDASASKVHAEITYEDGFYWIEDKGSTNGTWVNRHRIRRRVELHRGDVIQIGETRLQVN